MDKLGLRETEAETETETETERERHKAGKPKRAKGQGALFRGFRKSVCPKARSANWRYLGLPGMPTPMRNHCRQAPKAQPSWWTLARIWGRRLDLFEAPAQRCKDNGPDFGVKPFPSYPVGDVLRGLGLCLLHSSTRCFFALITLCRMPAASRSRDTCLAEKGSSPRSLEILFESSNLGRQTKP